MAIKAGGKYEEGTKEKNTAYLVSIFFEKIMKLMKTSVLEPPLASDPLSNKNYTWNAMPTQGQK